MKADLSGANLQKANLLNAKTYGWNIENADFTRAIMPDGEILNFNDLQRMYNLPIYQTRKIINTDKAPEPPNSRNQAVVVNGTIYVAAQIGIDPRLNSILHEDDIGKQTEQIMANLEIILAEAGANWAEVVKTTIFLKNMGDFPAMNAVYASYFDAETAPVCACVAVSQLPQNALVQIECVASSR